MMYHPFNDLSRVTKNHPFPPFTNATQGAGPSPHLSGVKKSSKL